MSNVATMSPGERIAEAMRRSIRLLPGGARDQILAMLSPASLAIITATLVVWVGSHLFGVGEIVDILLLGVGFIALGFSIFPGAEELYEFGTSAVQARTDAELDMAANHFANAVTILGISTVQAVLLRGGVKSVISRGAPRIYVTDVGMPPPAGNQLRLQRPASIRNGVVGETDPYGTITIARNQPVSQQRITLYHELVHRFFSPRTGPMRKLRANASLTGYAKSSFLRYIEEALAEGYAQLKVNGLAEGFRAYRFPIDGGYVTVSSLQSEGTLIGKITLGSSTFHVSISGGPVPHRDSE